MAAQRKTEGTIILTRMRRSLQERIRTRGLRGIISRSARQVANK
jgi:hypothetical protein